MVIIGSESFHHIAWCTYIIYCLMYHINKLVKNGRFNIHTIRPVNPGCSSYGLSFDYSQTLHLVWYDMRDSFIQIGQAYVMMGNNMTLYNNSVTDWLCCLCHLIFHGVWSLPYSFCVLYDQCVGRNVYFERKLPQSSFIFVLSEW